MQYDGWKVIPIHNGCKSTPARLKSPPNSDRSQNKCPKITCPQQFPALSTEGLPTEIPRLSSQDGYGPLRVYPGQRPTRLSLPRTRTLEIGTLIDGFGQGSLQVEGLVKAPAVPRPLGQSGLFCAKRG